LAVFWEEQTSVGSFHPWYPQNDRKLRKDPLPASVSDSKAGLRGLR
jgi:hypothetical protein